MTYDLNEALNLALDIIGCGNYRPAKSFSPWPNNVYIEQDREVEHYAYCLRELFFDGTLLVNDERTEKNLWQMLQIYRVINASISSNNDSLDKDTKKELKDFRENLEQDENFKLYLKK